MLNKSLILSLLVLFAIAPAANAEVKLIAIGSLDGKISDRSTQTSAPLENGVAGNLLGGLGSGLAYAGNNTFIAIPDRGPNAVSYNSAVSDTASYINRFQTIKLELIPSSLGSALPFTLTPSLIDTTLLSSNEPLYYGSGAGLGVPSGVPALNTNGKYYFTGRSDNFDPSQISTYSNNARFDPEGVRVSKSGEQIFISDEYGPYIYEFNRNTGKRIKVFNLPSKFAVSNLSPVSDTEINGNTSGRVTNKGMEGLAITPNGKTLVGILQSPLLQDGGTNGAYTRIVKIDIETGATQEYAYQLDNIGTADKPKYPTVSEILAINDNEFLVDERDGKGLGDGSKAAFKKIYHIDLTNAQEVSNITGESNLVGKAVSKTLFLDVVTALTQYGIKKEDIPAKLEGLAFGEDVVVNGVEKHTLFIANDNDFLGTLAPDTNHSTSVDNPNKFFVFAVDSIDLPGFVPQKIKGKN
ncbi:MULTISPECIES: esterase-like activity of phytase family protein [unclassified Nostoc]|uniref:esterase-like activity of phytase family protein n=1 Tax=unclassified Nostoc TaxID=2593658 RepID=UPI002AD45809|nr:MULTISPECIES: esterase-like activity of phytase family protein [unclassified Nostoc]MDZ8123768.1 esterase-like activity of phytase family protein [Nostoc sp. CmiVER01]MDZ8221558.1 esterase-like activity of phytase family protein [Nostoc sp. ChiVER01]